MVRRYTLKQRAQAQDETRDRIIRATVALHEKLGPKATTISAIAEEAGVQRLTVYRHFPDDKALFRACSTHWFARNQPPDPSLWAHVTCPRERARAALSALYRYYRTSRRMFTSVFRDEAVPEVRATLDPLRAYLKRVADNLCGHFDVKPAMRAQLSLTLKHAVRFQTWSSLAEFNLSDADAAKLVISWIDGLVPPG